MADLDNIEYFVDPHSVVRKIWGNSDTILLIFAGASAEFALNKAVDWLYFTGRLPADPLGRLFSTVSYAREIIFSEKHAALKEIDIIVSIHAAIEEKRGISIPDFAYRDVLFMLIDYSIKSYELLEKELTYLEKTEVFGVFKRLGLRMGINGLPNDYIDWLKMRQDHLKKNLIHSHYSADLLIQYRKHLGLFRFRLLVEVQKLILPRTVSEMMNFSEISFLFLFVKVYKIVKNLKIIKICKSLIMPDQYKKSIIALDQLSIEK